MKASNPKEPFGDAKLPLGLIPEPALAWLCVAMLDGKRKYGAYNWRTSNVSTTTYINAAKRHLALLQEGQDLDPSTGVHHAAYVMACMAIYLDAFVAEKLTDDRPTPNGGHDALVDHLQSRVMPGLKFK